MTTTPPPGLPSEPASPAPRPGFGPQTPTQPGFAPQVPVAVPEPVPSGFASPGPAQPGFGPPSVPVQPGFGPPPVMLGRPVPAARRARRVLWAGVAAVLVPVLVGGAVWWAHRGPDDPLAGRPRVTDAEAGLSYAVPEGWRHDATRDENLIDAFSSQMTRTADPADRGSSFMAGPAGQPVAPADLKRATETAARSNAEFFFPDRTATLEDSRSATVGGRPAHTAVLEIATGDGATAHLEMTVVTVDAAHTGFLLGVTTGTPQDSALRELDEITASADTVTAAD
ncbi:hypothetical protein ACLMNJ_35570 [Streptomyces seoulensis]